EVNGVLVLAEPRREAGFAAAPAPVGERRLARLLHHVAELAGEQETAAADHRRLDDQHLAARLGPGEAAREAGLGGARDVLADQRRRAERGAQVAQVDRDVLGLALGDATLALAD